MTAAEDTPTAPPASLADAVNARLDAFGWTRNRLANAIGVEHPTIARICAGQTRQPHPETVRRIEVTLGFDGGFLEAVITRNGASCGVPPGPRPQRSMHVVSSPTATPRLPIPAHKPRDVMHLDVPTVTGTAPGPLALPDPALRWRSPRNLAGRVEQVERWTYALAVARILVEQAERAA